MYDFLFWVLAVLVGMVLIYTIAKLITNAVITTIKKHNKEND